jgi:hypothetical protein
MKNLLGSGSKGRTSPSGAKGTRANLDLPNQGDMPWVDPAKADAAQRAGGAGNMLRRALNRSKSTGIKP